MPSAFLLGKERVDETEVLRTGDVQEILGVGRKEVYRLIAAGALPAVRAGRGYRILKAALVEWLAGRNL